MESRKLALPNSALTIIKLLEAGGYKAHVVGGCVRDSLLGRVPGDWDITTSATPDQTTGVFRKNGFKVIPTGIEHGTVSVLISGETYEVTTYRIDGEYSDGRRPDSVSFVGNIKEDLARRDFTINAMAYNNSDGLIDFFDGREDIEKKLIRCVGSAFERFSEDYLRILRAYRFSATLGFGLDPEIEQATRELKPRLCQIAAERIRVELDKTLSCGNLDGIFEMLSALSDVLFPEIFQNNGEFDEFKRVLRSLDADCSDILRIRLAALLLRGGAEKADKILRELKYCNKTREFIVILIKNAKGEEDLPIAQIKRLLNKIGGEAFDSLMFLKAALCKANGGQAEKYIKAADQAREIAKNGEAYTIAELALDGADIMRISRTGPGAWVGKSLKSMLEYVIENPEKNNKEDLTSFLLENIAVTDKTH